MAVSQFYIVTSALLFIAILAHYLIKRSRSKKFKINPDKFENHFDCRENNVIGQGGCASVYDCKSLLNKESYAYKVIYFF